VVEAGAYTQFSSVQGTQIFPTPSFVKATSETEAKLDTHDYTEERYRNMIEA
jgi:hypothetical protein